MQAFGILIFLIVSARTSCVTMVQPWASACETSQSSATYRKVATAAGSYPLPLAQSLTVRSASTAAPSGLRKKPSPRAST